MFIMVALNKSDINVVFTARCYAERGYATICRLFVRGVQVLASLAVITVWNRLTSKIGLISRLITVYMLELTPTAQHRRSGTTGTPPRK